MAVTVLDEAMHLQADLRCGWTTPSFLKGKVQKWFNEEVAWRFTETAGPSWNWVLDEAIRDGIWKGKECDEMHDMLYQIYEGEWDARNV